MVAGECVSDKENGLTKQTHKLINRYMSGGSSWHGPDILLDEDIVLVTINYRLGPFGFLSLNTAEYSGNMGLKDQLLALKWVNENIEFFGGKSFKS